MGSSTTATSTTTTTVPWLDLDMKLPALEEGSEPGPISELNLELRFDDQTPPTTMTILDPDIIWSSSEEHQKLHIHQPVMSPMPLSPTDDSKTRHDEQPVMPTIPLNPTDDSKTLYDEQPKVVPLFIYYFNM